MHDSSVVEELTRGMTGLFFCDAGYLKKAGDLSKLSESGSIICAATRKNMLALLVFFLALLETVAAGIVLELPVLFCLFGFLRIFVLMTIFRG